MILSNANRRSRTGTMAAQKDTGTTIARAGPLSIIRLLVLNLFLVPPSVPVKGLSERLRGAGVPGSSAENRRVDSALRRVQIIVDLQQLFRLTQSSQGILLYLTNPLPRHPQMFADLRQCLATVADQAEAPLDDLSFPAV